MRVSLLGEFSTESGKIVASDPCYKKIEKGNNVAFKVKPGNYDCYTVLGSLKDPLFHIVAAYISFLDLDDIKEEIV